MNGTAPRAPILIKQGASSVLCVVPLKEHLRDKSSKLAS